MQRHAAVGAATLVAGYGLYQLLGRKRRSFSLPLLKKQNSETSSQVIACFQGSPAFAAASKREGDQILARDQEDGEKLQEGITLAINKGVLPAKVAVEPVAKVDVLGKTAEAVRDEIVKQLGPAATSGCVLVLQGLSGTGKGTTVELLKAKLPKAVTWSNGNVFRALTLLATTYAEQKKCPLQDALTPANLASFVKMLSFGKHNGKDFDVKIEGLGINALVSNIQNTDLKKPAVGTNIPTVAQLTQGEVISFVSGALQLMAADGCSVLVEGREQTLNYIRTPHRFELVLSDDTIIGKRRAAQRMAASALKTIGAKAEASEAEVLKALDAALAELTAEATAAKK